MAGFEREQNKVVFFLNYWELLNGLMDVFTMISYYFFLKNAYMKLCLPTQWTVNLTS